MAKYEKVELLSPAGELDSLKSAIAFGADAVYFADKNFGMRTASKNFSESDFEKGLEFARKNGVKAYITVNIVPSNEEIENLKNYFSFLNTSKANAVIISDIGIMELAKKYAPALDIHISTQAGVTNYYTAKKLYELGAKRVVLARELSIEDIALICEKTPANLEIECFVHGAMCMSFSGRCLLAQYLTGRDANHGDCPQACRWEYKIVEAKRDNMPIDLIEDQTGTTIMNAQDMCMIEHIDDLVNAGVKSLKIEGRAKSAYYTGAITNAYRVAIDSYYNNQPAPKWALEEVNNVSHRAYSTGFYYSGKMSEGRRTPPSQTYNTGYIRNYKLLGNVIEKPGGVQSNSKALIETRNYFQTGDTVEIIMPGKEPIKTKICEIIDKSNAAITVSNKPMEKVLLEFENAENTHFPIPTGSFIRKELSDSYPS
ncbi:MAG: U32 family peptidase [Bifidobacteriaceae bacterium]|jgi:putative protease|nr:U32 family peptidase [Bifidobacteriaceae bacterium]